MTEGLQQVEDRYLRELTQHAQVKFERTRRALGNYGNTHKIAYLNARIKELRRQINRMNKEFQFKETS